MGKHGRRASAFRASLAAAGYDVLDTPREHGVVAATTRQLPDEIRGSIVDVYRALGGVRDDAEFTAGVWDFACSDGKSGGRWASPSPDAMFGGSDAPGVFSDKGSSRWKQRALYDAVRDAYAWSTPGVNLARVSIHDEIGGLNVNWATSHGLLLDPMELREFIESRTA